MTPRNKFPMPKREKLVMTVITVIAMLALAAAWLVDPEASADGPASPMGPSIQHCQPSGCDPLVWLLGPALEPLSAAGDTP